MTRATPSTHAYGPAPSQIGELYRPAQVRPAVVCLLHGGFWRLPYGHDELRPVAADLAERGFAVWNLEYRRLGDAGGGWPGTFEDVAAGIDHLATLAQQGVDLDLDRVVVAGHSAGGHLALWSAARSDPRHVKVRAVAGLAAVSDLAQAHALASGRNAVAELLGGSPQEYPQRFRQASPIDLLPLGVPQLVLHGALDEALPPSMSRRYVQAARAAGDSVEGIELAAAGHMDFLDPHSAAHAALCDWLQRSVGEL